MAPLTVYVDAGFGASIQRTTLLARLLGARRGASRRALRRRRDGQRQVAAQARSRRLRGNQHKRRHARAPALEAGPAHAARPSPPAASSSSTRRLRGRTRPPTRCCARSRTRCTPPSSRSDALSTRSRSTRWGRSSRSQPPAPAPAALARAPPRPRRRPRAAARARCAPRCATTARTAPPRATRRRWPPCASSARRSWRTRSRSTSPATDILPSLTDAIAFHAYPDARPALARSPTRGPAPRRRRQLGRLAARRARAPRARRALRRDRDRGRGRRREARSRAVSRRTRAPRGRGVATVHVGDDPATDVAGARAAGLDGRAARPQRRARADALADLSQLRGAARGGGMTPPVADDARLRVPGDRSPRRRRGRARRHGARRGGRQRVRRPQGRLRLLAGARWRWSSRPTRDGRRGRLGGPAHGRCTARARPGRAALLATRGRARAPDRARRTRRQRRCWSRSSTAPTRRASRPITRGRRALSALAGIVLAYVAIALVGPMVEELALPRPAHRGRPPPLRRAPDGALHGRDLRRRPLHPARHARGLPTRPRARLRVRADRQHGARHADSLRIQRNCPDGRAHAAPRVSYGAARMVYPPAP